MNTHTTPPNEDWSLRFENLTLTYGGGAVPALRNISLQVRPGQILAIIGETGSGKSTLVRAALGLVTAGSTTSGVIRVKGRDGAEVQPLTLGSRGAGQFRRESIGYVPQLTQRALVPVCTVLEHFEQFAAKSAEARGSVKERAITALSEIGLQDAPRVLTMYPHQLSGGMAQRVCIALAMFGSARIVVADEPTSGLDALVRRRVADLLEEKLVGDDRTLLLVTHDLALAQRLSTHVAVLFRGQLLETASTEEFFTAPKNPYSKHLLASVPRPGEPLPAPYNPATFLPEVSLS